MNEADFLSILQKIIVHYGTNYLKPLKYYNWLANTLFLFITPNQGVHAANLSMNY